MVRTARLTLPRNLERSHIECFVFAGCLSMDKLLVYKYTNAGKVERLRIMREVSPIWRDLGCLMGINPYHLKAIEVDRNGLIKDCCSDIFQIWLEQQGGR